MARRPLWKVRRQAPSIENLRRKARRWLWHCFRPPLRDQKAAELEQEYVERMQGEDDKHARFMEELRAMILDHGTEAD